MLSQSLKAMGRTQKAPLDEVMSHESEEVDSLYDGFGAGSKSKDTRQPGASTMTADFGAFHRRYHSQAAIDDEKRRNMQDLFRARLLNNKDKDSLVKLKSDVMKRETWNYKVSYDGQEPYRPPTHIPVKPTQDKRNKRLI